MTTALATSRNPMVYLVDDDKDDIYFIKRAFSELDPQLQIKSFLNGEQLINALRDEKNETPAFVLLDLNMPVLDGRETLRLVREEFGYSLSVIVFTTSNHQHEKELCYEYGANAFYTKPVSYSLYLEMLRNLREEYIGVVTA